MAALTYQGPSGQTMYAVLYDIAGNVWNTALNSGAGGYEPFNAAHWTNYAIGLVEQAGSGFYAVICPTGAVGTLASYAVRLQTGASAAITDIVMSIGTLVPVVDANGQMTVGTNQDKANYTLSPFDATAERIATNLDASISSRLAATAIGQAALSDVESLTDYAIDAGVAFIIPFQATDPLTGVPIDLTGAALTCLIKERVYDADGDAIATLTTGNGAIIVTDAPNGTGQVVVPATATSGVLGFARYAYTVRRYPLSGGPTDVQSGVIDISAGAVQS